MSRCRKVMNAQSQLHDEAAFKHCIIAICFRNGFYERGHFYLLSPFLLFYIHLFALMKFRLSLRQTQNITHYEHPIRWNVDTHGCSHIISVIKAWKLQHCISPHLSFYFYFELCQCPYLQVCDWLQHTTIYYLIYVKNLNNKWPIKTLSFWF